MKIPKTTIRFETVSPDRFKKYTIRLIYTVDGKRAYMSTGLKAKFDWTEENCSDPIINLEIARLRNCIAQVALECYAKRQKLDSRAILEQVRNPEGDTKVIVNFIDDLVKNTDDYRPTSLNNFRNIRAILNRYLKGITFDALDEAKLNHLKKALITAGKNDNTIYKYFSILKTILTKADLGGIYVHQAYRKYKVAKGIDSEVVALTFKELQSFISIEVPVMYQNAKDVFVFASVTSLRFCDLMILEWVNIKEEYITFIDEKTKSRLNIPITAPLREILDRQKGKDRPLPDMNICTLNNHIKAIGRMLGMDEQVEVVKQVGGIRKRIAYPKSAKLSIHKGRKTFVSVCLEHDVPVKDIMDMTGHRTYESFDRYGAKNKEKHKRNLDFLG